jgi:hypothetical protein
MQHHMRSCLTGTSLFQASDTHLLNLGLDIQYDSNLNLGVTLGGRMGQSSIGQWSEAEDDKA